MDVPYMCMYIYILDYWNNIKIPIYIYIYVYNYITYITILYNHIIQPYYITYVYIYIFGI